MINMVDITSERFVLNPKLDEAKTDGIIKNIIKGLTIPPVKKIKDANCIISIIKNTNADLSES